MMGDGEATEPEAPPAGSNAVSPAAAGESANWAGSPPMAIAASAAEELLLMGGLISMGRVPLEASSPSQENPLEGNGWRLELGASTVTRWGFGCTADVSEDELGMGRKLLHVESADA